MFGELLRIRYSSELFRLGTEADVQSRVAFLNGGPDQIPGLVVMTLSDQLDPDLDANHRENRGADQRQRRGPDLHRR